MQHPIIVIGAGMVGASTALWLQRSGHKVLLLDKGKPGMGASYGNAGLIAQWAVTPVTTPDLWKSIPSYLFSPNSALFLKWSYLPKLAPWLRKFLAHANGSDARRISASLGPLLTDALEQHRSLVRGTPLEKWISESKFSYAYRTHEDFEKDDFSWEMKRLAGFTPTVLTGREVQDEEPILGSSYQCLAVLDGHGHITNPGQYIAEMVDYFTAQGGQFIEADVKGFTKSAGKVASVETDQGSFACSKAVITAGIWSKELMSTLGLSVPLEAERGYHVIYQNPSEMPRNPMMITDGKFGVNPMDMGLRCAGTVELGSHLSEPSEAPVKLIRKYTAQAFPDLSYSGTEEWMGFRPSTPDSLPLIGELEGSGIYLGFGHQHVGLTAGPKTGRLIAQLIDNSPPNIDMTPYAPDRFKM